MKRMSWDSNCPPEPSMPSKDTTGFWLKLCPHADGAAIRTATSVTTMATRRVADERLGDLIVASSRSRVTSATGLSTSAPTPCQNTTVTVSQTTGGHIVARVDAAAT